MTRRPPSLVARRGYHRELSLHNVIKLGNSIFNNKRLGGWKSDKRTTCDNYEWSSSRGLSGVELIDGGRPRQCSLYFLMSGSRHGAGFIKKEKNRIPNYLTLCRYYRNLIVFASETLRPRIINLRIARCNFLFSRRNTNRGEKNDKRSFIPTNRS